MRGIVKIINCTDQELQIVVNEGDELTLSEGVIGEAFSDYQSAQKNFELRTGTVKALALSDSEDAEDRKQEIIEALEGIVEGPGCIHVRRSAEVKNNYFGEKNTVIIKVPGQRDLILEDLIIPPSSNALNKNLDLMIFYTGAVLSYDGRVIWAQVMTAQEFSEGM